MAAHLADFRRDRQGDTFRGWLRVVTRNAVALHFRRRGRQPQGLGGTDALVKLQDLPDPGADVPDGGDDKSEADGLRWRALEMVRGEFEERTWRMFWQAFVDERSPVDIAAEMGVTPAAVRKAKSRVLHRLKEQFADLLS